MMRINGVSHSKISFEKRRNKNEKINQQDRDILMVYKDKDNNQMVVFSTPTKANQALTKDLFQKKTVENKDDMIKANIKNDLATRIIAFQQMMIEDLQAKAKV